ncbi:hypothetical protein EON67_03915 [archaeon]|nr:MAG: hypothetical protein EON67_03915 [archaeon]
MWRNPNNWLPLQAVLYIDEALDNFIHAFQKAVSATKAEDLQGVARLAAMWTTAEPHLHRHLVRHKNAVLFPALNEVVGGVADSFTGLNMRSADRVVRAHNAVQALLDATTPETRAAALDTLRNATSTWFTELSAQLTREHQVLYPVAEKLMTLQVHKALLKHMWDAQEWAALVPWTLRHLPTKDRRLRMLRALQWAMPERTQQIGLYIVRDVDAVMWADLTRDMPALIPRGMPGWSQYL